MDNADRWYFTKDQLANTPSRKCGISEARELSFRQQAANFIQDMGQRLQVNQLCINTAIVYMHRFYVFHSFTEIHRNKLSLSALFLAAKVEEQPRKLEHLIKVAHACLHKDLPPIDVRSEAYQEKMFEVVAHENILLQTLGFVLAIEHPHTYVVKVCQLVKASKDLAQTSYIMATTSLHMTTMCLMYKPTLVACVCIHLACKWSDWRIEKCSEGRDWFFYVDKTVTNEKLEVLTDRFIAIMETSPHRFKKKFGQKDVHGARSLMDEPSTSKAGMSGDMKTPEFSPGPSGIPYDFKDYEEPNPCKEKSPSKSFALAAKPSTPSMPSAPNSQLKKQPVKEETTHSISLDVYREKREKERQQGKAPPEPPAHPQSSKKPQHAFHDAQHRTSSKHPEVKDRSRVPEGKLENSASKLNHQVGKEGSHFKERSNAHDLIPYERVDALLQNKISPLPYENRVDYVKPEKMDFIPDRIEDNKSENVECNKQEKAFRISQGRIEPYKPGRMETSRHDKLDAVLPEHVDHLKQEKMTSKLDKIYAKQKTDNTQHDKMDHNKQERIEHVKHDKDHSRHEKVDHPKHEKVDHPKHEKVDHPKHEKVDHPKHERVDHPKHERVDHPKHERVDHPKHEKVDYPKHEKVDHPKQEKVDHPKHDQMKAEKMDHVRQHKVEHVRHDKIDHIKHDKVDIKAEHRNSIPLTINTSLLSRSSHREEGAEIVKKERREKHKKHSSHSKERSNHIEHAPPAGIKVKIPKTIINLSGKVPESSQKYSKPESPKRSLKIKLPKPPEEARIVKPVASTSIKLVITKDKSGSGSYSTSQKNEKESRKRVHSNSIPDGNGKTVYDAPPSKHQKLDHSQRSHHSNSSGGKSSKSSRHGSHRSSSEHSVNDSGCYSIPQYPANGNNAQSYSQNYMYNFPPPPQPPKMKAYAMATGKTNSNPPLPPPLPPPPPPPPE